MSAVLGAGRDALSAPTAASASGPQANASLGVYEQQAAEGASSVYGDFPKEAETFFTAARLQLSTRQTLLGLVSVISGIITGM